MNDFYSDHGALLGRLFRTSQDMPEVLKTAEYPTDQFEIAGLADTAFADPDNRTFLIHNPGCTLASFTYLKVAGVDDLDPRMVRTQKAASLFGIESEIHRLADLIASRKRAEQEQGGTKKEASERPDESWRISVIHDGQVAEQQGYGKAAFLEACTGVMDRSTVVLRPAGFVQKIARALLDEALRIGGEFYRDVPDDMFKLAGHGYPDPDELQASIAARAIALPLDQRATFYEKVASLREGAGKDVDSLRSLVQTIDSFDRENGLNRFYGVRFPDPLRSIHSISTRKAASLVRTVKVGTATYLAEALASGAAQKVALHVLGEDGYLSSFPDGFSPFKLASLDGRLAEAFNRLVQSEDVFPVEGR